ncbi:MAG: uroporphyrinogen-III synthase [Planctomycetes bacterium]|nr:uroporphyrinogen-III synthase [Planctomycetota bacterium]
MSLNGRTIALAEGRQIEELAEMLEKDGAAILRCPMLSILDHPNSNAVTAWLRELIAGRFSHVILLTGEGLRRLLACAEREEIREPFIGALRRVRIITRGPKPVQALKAIGLAPTRIASAPTTDGVIVTLAQESLSGAEVGVQFYCETNPPLTDYLASVGAIAHPVLPYVYAPSADSERVADLIERMAEGKVDGLVFTSSPQIDRLFEVAAELKQEELLDQGLRRVKVAAVGPIVKEKLLEKKVRVDITPEQGFVMKNLVQHIKRALGN